MACHPPVDAELVRRRTAPAVERVEKLPCRGSGTGGNVGDANPAHGVRDPLPSSRRPGGGGGRHFSLGAGRKGRRRPCVAALRDHDAKIRRKEKKKGPHAWLGFLTSCLLCSSLAPPDDATNINRREVIRVEPYFSIPAVAPPAIDGWA